MTPRLQEKYRNEIRPKLMEEFGIGNVHAVPALEKISVNMAACSQARDRIVSP